MSPTVTTTRAVFEPTDSARTPVELSDIELEHVVGGLARVRVEDVRELWSLDATIPTSTFSE